MYTKPNRNVQRLSRVRRVRSRISGTAERPRLVVNRSLHSITAQLIDDTSHKTIASATDKGLTGKPVERAQQVGQNIAALAKNNKISQVVFDRAGYQYHGRVAALAEGAREAGLKF